VVRDEKEPVQGTDEDVNTHSAGGDRFQHQENGEAVMAARPRRAEVCPGGLKPGENGVKQGQNMT